MPTVIGLIKRKPSLSFEEFSIKYTQHGILVAPLLKKYGVQNYQQFHTSDFLKTNWANVVGGKDRVFEADAVMMMEFADMEILGRMAKDPYYLEVILADEEVFLDKSPELHLLSTVGNPNPVIVNGELMVDVSSVLEVWQNYEDRGRGNETKQ